MLQVGDFSEDTLALIPQISSRFRELHLHPGLQHLQLHLLLCNSETHLSLLLSLLLRDGQLLSLLLSPRRVFHLDKLSCLSKLVRYI